MSIIRIDTSYITFNLMLTGDSLTQFKEILARGLNTAPPEKYPDWFKLAEQLMKEDERKLI